jgi:hypothetical protein
MGVECKVLFAFEFFFFLFFFLPIFFEKPNQGCKLPDMVMPEHVIMYNNNTTD